MDFFGIGAGELLLILILVLIIWGPGKLPEVARTLGRMARALRKATYDLTNEMTRDIDEDKKKLPSPPSQNSMLKPQKSPEADKQPDAAPK